MSVPPEPGTAGRMRGMNYAGCCMDKDSSETERARRPRVDSGGSGIHVSFPPEPGAPRSSATAAFLIVWPPVYNSRMLLMPETPSTSMTQ